MSRKSAIFIYFCDSRPTFTYYNGIIVLANFRTLITFVFIAYSANVAAFLSEVFRSSILSIPKGQTEAAYSCGMTAGKTFAKIVLPQAFRIALPNMWTFMISLLKSTSLVYMIGVVDIIGRAQAIGSATSHSLESYIIIALVFTVL